MKNHEWRDGRLLQTNKRWSRLKQRQREWTHEAIKEEYAAFVKETGRLPTKGSKQEIVDKVYGRIGERGIWIPYGEAHENISKAVERLNRKASAQTDEAQQG
jgi:hypothetical protein